MKPQNVKRALLSAINEVSCNSREYCFNPDVDFTRKRKISFQAVVAGLIGMEGKSLSNEVIDMFMSNSDIPTASAFIQQRDKLKPEALLDIFRNFCKSTIHLKKKEIPIIAIDGSEIRIPDNPDDQLTRVRCGSDSLSYNSLHLNAFYDIKRGIYSDVELQNGAEQNEYQAFQRMVDRSTIPKALVLADRGYESFNNMAHIQEKGWFFLIRIKDGNNNGIKAGLDLPADEEYDVSFNLMLTRKQTHETKELLKDRNHYRYISSSTLFDYLPVKNRKADPARFYELRFRMVRFKLSENTYETVLTNLDKAMYPPHRIKELYASRWGIETSFRHLKYTLGLLKFHSKKTVCIRQEIYAKLIMYTFVGMITSHVIITKKQRKLTYKANFSTAAHTCRLFFLGKTSPSVLESVIESFLIPIRPNRHRGRFNKHSILQEFLYRLA